MAFVDSVTASADKTQVTFKLKEPFGLFLNRIASFQDLWIMPQEFIESSETASEDSMLGSGPFIFDKFEPSVVMSWKKNPDYFEKDADGNRAAVPRRRQPRHHHRPEPGAVAVRGGRARHDLRAAAAARLGHEPDAERHHRPVRRATS